MPSFKLLQKIIVCLILFGLLAPTVILAAATSTLVVGAPPPPVPPGQTDPEIFLKPPITRNGQKIAQKTLSEWRKDDQRQCEAEAKGNKNPTLGRAVVDAIVKPLKGAINEKMGLEAIPNAVNETIANSAAPAIETELEAEMQNGIKERFREEFPKTFGEKLEAALATGLTEEELMADRGSFRGLVRDSIRESLPRALNEDFVGNGVSDAVDRGLRRSLQENLRLNFGQIAEPTIEQYYKLQIETTLKQIPDMVKDEVENLEATIKGTQAAFQVALQDLNTCFTDTVCIVTKAAIIALTGDPLTLVKDLTDLINNFLAQLQGTAEFLKWVTEFIKNKDQFVKDMVKGLSVQLEQSLTQPKNIARLGDAITEAISDPINQSLENNIDQVMDALVDPLKTLEESIDSIDDIIIDKAVDALDLQIGQLISQVTTRATRVIDVVGDELATRIDETVGAVLYPVAAGITGEANIIGDFVGDGINTVGYGVQDLLFPRPQVSLVGNPEDGNFAELPPGQMYQRDYDFSQEFGLHIVPDGAPLREGEMHWSTYQSSLSDIRSDGDLTEGEFLGPNGAEGAPLTGAMDTVSGAAAETTQDAVGPVTDQALAKQGAGELGKGGGLGANISKSLGGAVSGIVTSSITSMLEGVPYVGPILAQVVEQIIAEAMSSVGLAPVAGGLPVMDVGAIWSLKGILSATNNLNKTSGKILGTEKQTADLTAKILTIQIQTCTNLKAMRRVQLLAEEKMFVWDPNARKAAAQALNAHKVSIINVLFNKGYKVSAGVAGADKEEQQSLQPTSIENYLNDGQKEIVGVFKDDINQLPEDYPFKQDLLASINNASPESGLDIILKPTDGWTKEKFDKFTQGDPEVFSLENLVIATQPQNNPTGASFLARQEVTRRVVENKTNRLNELLAAGGILPTKDCVDPRENGFCGEWKILTSGSIIKDYVVGILLSWVRQIELADENIQDFLIKDAPAVFKQISDLTSRPPSTLEQGDTCPGPGPCPTSGYESGKNLGQGQIDGAEAVLQNGIGDGGGGGGGFDFDGPAFNDGLEEIFNRPEVEELGLSEQSSSNLFNTLYNELPQKLDGNENPFELQTKVSVILTATVADDEEIPTENKDKVVTTLLTPTVGLLENLRQ